MVHSGVTQVSAAMLDTGRSALSLRGSALAALVVLLGLGLLRRYRQDSYRRFWPRVRGRVVAERDGSPLGGTSRYDSIIVFRTLDGAVVRGAPHGGLYLGIPVVGREVPVWYDPRDPNLFEARLHALDRAGSPALLAAVLPAALLLFSFLT